VGQYFVGSEGKTLVEHWNGTRWKHFSSPDKDGNGLLNGIYARSASNIWAVGSYGSGSIERSLIEHWNGKHWKVVSSPSLGGSANELTAIRGISSHSIWAVGDVVSPGAKTLILHYNGHRWKQVTSPSVSGSPNFLTAVRPVSATNAWAVGYSDQSAGDRTIILHWNGHHWRKASSPNDGSGDNLLRGVLATSSSNAWAVGNYNSGSRNKTLVLHWNGHHWRKVPSPNSTSSDGNALYAAGGTSSKNVYAVGSVLGSTTTKTLVLHWNGKHWRTVAARNPGHGNNFVGVFALNSSSIWAVGSYRKSGGHEKTLIEHCS
jgi:hypothetical protein